MGLLLLAVASTQRRLDDTVSSMLRYDFELSYDVDDDAIRTIIIRSSDSKIGSFFAKS
jgi:hypothetical protein